MKQFTKLVIAFSIIIFFQFLIPTSSFAQLPGEDLGDPDAPVDGGIVLLLTAGVLYGIHKLRVEKKRGLNSLNSK